MIKKISGTFKTGPKRRVQSWQVIEGKKPWLLLRLVPYNSDLNTIELALKDIKGKFCDQPIVTKLDSKKTLVKLFDKNYAELK